ncbi:hypothetical protein MRX96_039466 [Rhipicephalus microplus]
MTGSWKRKREVLYEGTSMAERMSAPSPPSRTHTCRASLIAPVCVRAGTLVRAPLAQRCPDRLRSANARQRKTRKGMQPLKRQNRRRRTFAVLRPPKRPYPHRKTSSPGNGFALKLDSWRGHRGFMDPAAAVALKLLSGPAL